MVPDPFLQGFATARRGGHERDGPHITAQPHGVGTKHLLRYFHWYVRIAAMAPTRAHAAAR